MQRLWVVSGGWVAIGAVTDDLAVAYFDDTFGPRCDFTVMGNQNHHVALAGQLIQQGHDLGAAVAVEGTGGLVGENDMPTVHQGPGDRHPLLLASGQLMRTVGCAFGQTEPVKQGGGAGMTLGGGHPGINGGHFDVFLSRGRGDQVITLKHKAERLTA